MTEILENKLSTYPEPIIPFVAMVLSEIPNEPSRIWTLNEIWAFLVGNVLYSFTVSVLFSNWEMHFKNI